MNFSRYMINLCEQDEQEQDAPNNVKGAMDFEDVNKEATVESDIELSEDNSGFDSDDTFGVDKTDLPEEEGLNAAIDSADQLAVASDGHDTDIDLSFHAAFPEDNSGFEEDANSEIEPEEVKVDPNTVPAVPEEADQFEPENAGDEVGSNNVTAEELADDADDEIDIPVDESATGWDDLF